MTTATTSAAELRHRLADDLTARGAIRTSRCYSAFTTIPRELFVPEFAVQTADGLRTCRQGDPGWLETVYTDNSLLTQFDTAGAATSSSSQPFLMAHMLEALDLHDDHQVLEVGIGTGYNAALLCHHVGDENVVTIDIDPALAQAAGQRLDAAGYRPRMLAGDGRAGHPNGAPYDRLIATCGFDYIPVAWLEQVRPGGIIVCPLGGGIVRLIVGNGCTGEGRFLADAAFFMPARDLASGPAQGFPAAPADLASRPSKLAPTTLLDESVYFVLTLALPGIQQRFLQADDGTVQTAQLWGSDGSWAELRSGVACQAGPRRLLDDAERAVELVGTEGRPGREQFGVSATPGQQWAWLGGPTGPSWRLT